MNSKVIISIFIIALMVDRSEQLFGIDIAKLFVDKSCEKASWCAGTPVGDCKNPLINQKTCCYYCPTDTVTTTIATTTTTTTTPRPLANKIIEIIGSNPNELIIVKTTIERVPKECPRSVGFPGCFIVDRCTKDSDCLSNERCCLRDCTRICVRV